MRKLFFLILLISCIFLFPVEKVNAQSRLGVYLGGGATWYYGDMNDRILTHPKLFRNYFNGGLLYRLNSRFDVLGNLTIGRIAGADSLAIQEFNRKRNLYFESRVLEVSLLFNYRLLGYSQSGTRKLNPYIIAGIGYLQFNPQADFNGEKIDLQSLGTEGQFINGGGYPKPYKLYTLSMPLGIGVEIPLSRAFHLRLEYANHFTLTDYLDDLSSRYADSTALANTPNGPVAIQLSSNFDTGYPQKDFGRGNTKQRDSFSTFGVSLLYTPVFSGGNSNAGGSRNKGVIGKKKKRKHSCPAFD